MTKIYCTKIGEEVRSENGICPLCKVEHEARTSSREAAEAAWIKAQNELIELLAANEAADDGNLTGTWTNIGSFPTKEWGARVQGGYPGAVVTLINKSGKETTVTLGEGNGLIFTIC